MKKISFIGLLLVTASLFIGSPAIADTCALTTATICDPATATTWTVCYNASNGYTHAGNTGECKSWISFDDWGCVGPGGRHAPDFKPINGNVFGPTIGQEQHVVTLRPDLLTLDPPQDIKKDMTNTPIYTNANMDGQVNLYYWGYTTPGFDRQADYTDYKKRDYSKSMHKGCIFDPMLIDLAGDYFVSKDAMHFAYFDTFSYVDATGENPRQDVTTSVQFQPYPVSDGIGWCGSVLAPHPAYLTAMPGQLTFDFAFDAYYVSGENRTFYETQIIPRFEMRAYGSLNVHVWVGSELQTFTSRAVMNNANPENQDPSVADPNFYNNVSFHGGGVVPDGVWVSADSYNADGSHVLNPDGTWNVTVVEAGTEGAVWYKNTFAGFAFILRADAYRMIDSYNSCYGPDPCANKNCDDNNPCTTDSCAGGTCLHKDACPADEKCDPTTGACGPRCGIPCNDNNACTIDTCDTATGCVYKRISCNDNDACTADTCDTATGCVHKPIICNDNNACTADTCDPATGCVYTPVVVCNSNDPCAVGSCDPTTVACVYTPKNCDDGNVCTTDFCDTATGNCVNTPIISCGPIDTTNNNFTMNQPDGVAFGGTNDVHFTWDGTRKTSVAVSGLVSNATLSSSCPFFGTTWSAHDVAIYGPGTYTVYSACPAGSPGCGIVDATHPPITFTVNDGEIGGHMLFDWNNNLNIDVVNVWTPQSAYGPSPLWTTACNSNPADKVWDWMSRDVDGDGVNGYHMVDGPFKNQNANFNLMGMAVNTINNNFTMNQPNGVAFGGTNDVRFTWDGTRKTAVAEYGQLSNATLSSSCPFFGTTWSAHDVAIYGPGTYTVYTACDAGSPGCGAVDATHPPITFTVYDGEIGGHMLFDWNGNLNIDVVNVWTPQSAYGPSPLWTTACNSNPADKVWDWMSRDVDDDGVNGYHMVDGPFRNQNANFNFMGVVDFCRGKVCNDNNACTDDACDPYTGQCVFTPAIVDDGNACTVDSCDPVTGVFHVLISCDDNNACTSDSCDSATGCVHTPIPGCGAVTDCTGKPAGTACDDNNACTTNDKCVKIHRKMVCKGTPVANGTSCDDGNLCTTGDACYFGFCKGKLKNCSDGDACTNDSCDKSTGECVHTARNCDDHNPCTIDTCDSAKGCVHAVKNCDDGNKCTRDYCDDETGTCVHKRIDHCDSSHRLR